MQNITFEGIKQSLIEYYSSQDEFKDFNWTAPAITTLIDAQAYLAHYLCTYANFALNESFLDTAQKRSSVVSKARNIGYYPEQYKTSVASLKLDYTGSVNLDGFVIPVGTTFAATNNGTTYYFRTYEPAAVQKTQSGRYWAQVNVREGTEVTNKWTQNKESNIQFILSNPKVDLSTITVKVYENESDTTGVTYNKIESIAQFGPDAAIYTVEENTEENIQLVFGDGILGKKIVPGNIVECKYVATSGSEANGIAVFQLVSIPGEGYDKQRWTVTTVSVSNSGGDRESIESIKLNAPRFFQRQGRDVIAEDYRADVMKHYGSIIDAISVWGGENNTPPEYGSVFISIKPKNALSLSSTQKNNIIATVLQSSVVGITPKIVDPNVLYVNMEINATYNKLQTLQSPVTIKEQLTEVAKSFFNNSLSSFNIDFRYSKFLAALFGVDSSITDIDTNVSIYQYITPAVNTETSYLIDFKNAIEPGTVYIGPYAVLGTSSSMYYMDDDGNGTIRVRSDNYLENVGTVDYTTGMITLKSYRFSTDVVTQIPVSVKPANKNMSVSQNYIFSIDTIDVTLNGE